MPRKKVHDNPTDYKRQFNELTYDRISVTVPKGQKQAIEAYTVTHGKSINGLINELLRDVLGMSDEEWRNSAQEEKDG